MWRWCWQWVIVACLALGGCGKEASDGDGTSAVSPPPAPTAPVATPATVRALNTTDPIEALARCRTLDPPDEALLAECLGAASLARRAQGDRETGLALLRELMDGPMAAAATSQSTLNQWWSVDDQALRDTEKAGDLAALVALCEGAIALPLSVNAPPAERHVDSLWTAILPLMVGTGEATAEMARPWWLLCELAVRHGVVDRLLLSANLVPYGHGREQVAPRATQLAAIPGAPPAAAVVELVMAMELPVPAGMREARHLTTADLETLAIGHPVQAAMFVAKYARSLDGSEQGMVSRAQAAAARWLGARQEFAAADAMYRRAMASSTKEVAWQVEQADFDLARLPDQTRTLLEDEHPRADREQLADALRGYLRDGRFPMPPAHDALRQEAIALVGRWGVDELAARPAAALERLQYALRQDPPAALREEIRGALQGAIREAVANRPAEVETLTAFYVAELRHPGDPFVVELARILRAAADGMQPGEEAEQIFLLSLIADLFPDSPEGQAARDAAIASCRNLASVLTLQDEPPTVTSSSPLPGMSVIRIANATSHHLVWFAEGPDVVFVRLDPYRRASVVVRDGGYRKVVIVTSATVTPYRGEASYAGQQVISRYVVKQQGQSDSPRFGEVHTVQASGPYTLVATPPGLDEATARAVAEGAEDTDAYAEALADAALPQPTKARDTIDELDRHREDPAAFDALRGMASGAREPGVRAQAVAALIPFRRLHDAWSVWVDCLAQDDHSGVRMAALKAILLADHPDRATVLKEIALDHPDGAVRRELKRQLGTHPDWLADAPELLLAVCATDTDGQDGADALRLLGQLRVEASLPLLRARLYQEYTTQRKAAIGLFYPWAGDDRAFPLLLEAWESPEFASLHYDLALMMGLWHTRMGLTFIQEQLAVDPPTSIHYALLVGLKTAATAPKAPWLVGRVLQIASVRGPTNVRMLALQVLLQWQEPRVLPVAAAVLAAPTAKNRGETARALAAWGSPEALALLRPYADDKALGAYIKGILQP